MTARYPGMAKFGAVLLLSLVVCGVTTSAALAGGDVAVGRQKAQQCEICHGLDGLSKMGQAPNLAGQNEEYMVEQLKQFQSGRRQNEIMSLVAPTLSPEDIQNLAAYYAAIEIKVGKIPGE